MSDDPRVSETVDATGAPDEHDQDHAVEVLSESECWALLRSVDVGRLATPTADGGVEIFPVNFVVDHGTIVFRTATGTKLAGIESAASVAFEADDSDLADGVAWSVVVKGTADTIHGRSDVFESFDLDVRPWHSARKPYFIRVVPTATTGRRIDIRP